MFELFKSKPSVGGQHISFDKFKFGRKRSRTEKKVSVKANWRTCGSWNNVKFVVNGLQDSVASTTTTSFSAVDEPECLTLDATSLSNLAGADGDASSCRRNRPSSVSSKSSNNTQRHATELYHIQDLLNNTRRRWNSSLQPLSRSEELDALAARQATAMAKRGALFHSDASEVCSNLEVQPKRRLGENVVRGADALDMHMRMLEDVANYANMVDRRYNEVGMAAARGPKGELYLCQLYRG